MCENVEDDDDDDVEDEVEDEDDNAEDEVEDKTNPQTSWQRLEDGVRLLVFWHSEKNGSCTKPIVFDSSDWSLLVSGAESHGKGHFRHFFLPRLRVGYIF